MSELKEEAVITSSETPIPPPLSDACRSLFTSYYKQIHNQDIPDSAIISLLIEAYTKAVATHPYRCILEYRFAEPRIMAHPYYSTLISTNKTTPLKYLDIGCCMGTDIRQLIIDGFSPTSVYGIDVESDFIAIGTDILFKDKSLLEDKFEVVNILTPNVLDQHKHLRRFVGDDGIDVVYAGSLYHLLTEESTLALTQVIHTLLSSTGVLVARTVGSSAATPTLSTTRKDLRYLHSRLSLTKMLEQCGYIDIHISSNSIDMRADDPNHCMFSFSARKGSAQG